MAAIIPRSISWAARAVRQVVLLGDTAEWTSPAAHRHISTQSTLTADYPLPKELAINTAIAGKPSTVTAIAMLKSPASILFMNS